MLGFLFGFNSRLGRLHFFIATILFAVAMTVLTFAVVKYQLGFPSAEPDLLLPVLVVTPLALLGTATLYSMRLRDIGWNPAVVVPIWTLLAVCDALTALNFPQLAIDATRSGTMAGSLLNIIATITLNRTGFAGGSNF